MTTMRIKTARKSIQYGIRVFGKISRTYARAKQFKDPSPCLATIPARGTHSRVPLSRAVGFLFAGSLLNSSRTMEATSSASVGIRKTVVTVCMSVTGEANRYVARRYMRHGRPSV